FSDSALVVRNRDGRRMGRWRFAGNGESADGSSRNVIGIAPGGLCNRLSARRNLLLLRFPSLGMAADVLHRRTAGAAGAVRPLPRRRIRSLAAYASQGLEQSRPWHRVSLETVPLPDAADGGNELCLARYSGHVSDVPGARLGILAAEASRAHRALDGRCDTRRYQLRL